MKKPGSRCKLLQRRRLSPCSVLIFTLLISCATFPGAAQTALRDSTEYLESEEDENNNIEGYLDPAALESQKNEAEPNAAQWSVVSSDKVYSYRDDVEGAQKEETGKELSPADLPTGLFKFLLVLVVIIVAGVIIWRIVGGQGNFFAKRSKKHPAAKGEKDQNELAELPGDELERRMQEAAARGDLRSSVRFGFLRVLQILDNRGQIAYLPEKTNYAYEREIGNSALKQSFRGMRIAYERAWYGGSNPSQDDYTAYMDLFRNIKKETGA